MKRLLLVLILTIAAMGCKSSTGNDDTVTSATKNSPTAAIYFPLKTGATWTWAEEDITTGALTQFQVTTVTGTTEYLGKTCWTVNASTHHCFPFTATRMVRVEGDVLYCSNPYFLFKPAALADAGDSEWPIYKFDVPAGTSWVVADLPVEMNHTLVTGEYLGLETVTANGTVYENCAKFRFTTTEALEERPALETVWLAPNVGPVKKVLVSNMDNYTYTSVMTSHSIP